VPAAEPQPTRKARDDTKPPQQKNCGGYSRLQEGTDGRNPGGLDGTYERQLSAACQNLSANLELALESDVLGFTLLNNKGSTMRGILLWLIGIPIPIIILLWLFGVLH